MAEDKMILTINSRKGGVGKTTLALNIVRDIFLTEEAEMAVMVDADIFGTEMADFLFPHKRGEVPDEWKIGLADLLIQPTGGISSFKKFLQEKVKEIKDGLEPKSEISPGMPIWPMGLNEGSIKFMMIIPSFVQRDPRKRITWDAMCPPFIMLTESFGKIQIEMRMTALIDQIIRILKPKIIIIDNSPFHLPLSKVPEVWKDPEELRKTLCVGKNYRAWEEYMIRELEVTGTDGPDLMGLISELIDKDKRSKAFNSGKRLVINKDFHIPEPGGEKCPLCELPIFEEGRKEFGFGLEDAKEWGHVSLIAPLMFGEIGEILQFTEDKTAKGFLIRYETIGEGLKTRNLVPRIFQYSSLFRPRIFDGVFKEIKSWWSYLKAEKIDEVELKMPE